MSKSCRSTFFGRSLDSTERDALPVVFPLDVEYFERR